LVEEELLTLYQWEDEDMLAEGIERLATIITRMLHEETNGGDPAQSATAPQEDAKDLW
jgi:hypothetical protein